MILIADSGSTKCDWIFFDKSKEYDPVTTMGFNPFFHSTDLIRDQILRCQELQKIKNDITHLYYFGAGCSSKERNQIVENALKINFPTARIQVEHDLLGAAYASCGSVAGIACILGTGSNSCYFDGNQVHEVIPSLGYILGDEGGGDSIGRKLLAKYLYKQLPDYLESKFSNELHLTKESIFDAVYNKPGANMYLASFVHTLQDFKEEPFVQELIGESLREFLSIHVCCYPDYRTLPVNFVGSIAFHFEEILRKEAKDMGITIGTINKKPIFSLKHFFYTRHYGVPQNHHS